MSETQSPMSARAQRGLGLNARAERLVDALVAESESLRLRVSRLENGTRLIDAGIAAPGGLEAGRLIAELCLAGLGRVRLEGGGQTRDWPLSVQVSTRDPVLACLGSQYAGWSLSHGEGKGAFHALGSGPGRAMSRKEPLFDALGIRDQGDSACLILEVDRAPPAELADGIAAACGIAPESLTLVLTPTHSLAGTVQIVARVLEVALHKAHELGFPPAHIIDGTGTAPLPPPAADFLTAMGRTNDAILFGGSVMLFVDGSDDDARTLCERLPSSASRDYGRPFAEVFKAADYDFFAIDPMLFSPARVTVNVLRSGSCFRAGELDPALLGRSFGVTLR
jgi:methenyltetrahydromethanopterin cyclohydrolase